MAVLFGASYEHIISTVVAPPQQLFYLFYTKTCIISQSFAIQWKDPQERCTCAVWHAPEILMHRNLNGFVKYGEFGIFASILGVDLLTIIFVIQMNETPIWEWF